MHRHKTKFLPLNPKIYFPKWKFEDNWATSREKVSSRIFDQVRFKPVCSATEDS